MNAFKKSSHFLFSSKAFVFLRVSYRLHFPILDWPPLLYKYYIKVKTVVYRIHFILRYDIFPKKLMYHQIFEI